MDLTFLTPMAAIFAVSALLPLGVYWFRERRASGIRAHWGWKSRHFGPGRRSSSQWRQCPCARDSGRTAGPGHRALDAERTDAEAFFVMDTSRSMLAADGRTATR